MRNKDFKVTSQLANFLESMKTLEKEFERLTEEVFYLDLFIYLFIIVYF